MGVGSASAACFLFVREGPLGPRGGLEGAFKKSAPQRFTRRHGGLRGGREAGLGVGKESKEREGGSVVESNKHILCRTLGHYFNMGP